MPQRAVLLLNLGSPDSASVADVKRYLREFLGDGRAPLTKPHQVSTTYCGATLSRVLA